MLKNLFVALAMMFCLSAISMAKDGPFPIQKSVGVWHDLRSGMSIQITTGKIYNESGSVQVFVNVYSSENRLVAHGSGIHKLDDSILSVVVRDNNGNAMIASLKAQSLSSGHFRLLMDYSYLFGRQRAIHDGVLMRP